MQKSSAKTIFNGTLWGIISKIVSAGIQFVTIPLLIGHYGKTEYGLIALAYSLNAYLRLVDLGMNVGIVRYLSMWVAKKDSESIIKVSQSSIVFFSLIGFFNAIVFILIGIFSEQLFHFDSRQEEIFKWLMYILAASAILNWVLYIINQILTAYDEIAWISRTTIIASFLSLLSALAVLKFNLSMPKYFILYTLSFLLILPLNIARLRKTNLPIIQLLIPKWNYKKFKVVLGYGLSIFTMGIFQFSANNLRPILLGAYSNEGVGVVTEYRIVETISMLVMAIGVVFLQVLLPVSAKFHALKDEKRITEIIFGGTKYISLFLSLVIFGLIINADELLELYVGSQFTHLAGWLIIWLLTLFYMHNAPVSSLILSEGKVRPLVWSSAIGCVISLGITSILAPRLNVGAAVIGYLVYTIIQLLFNYFYYIPYVLHLNGMKIFFGSFIPAVLLGGATAYLAYFIAAKFNLGNYSLIIQIIVKSGLFVSLFLAAVFTFSIRKKEIIRLYNQAIG